LLGSSLEDEVAGLDESGLAGEASQRARAADTNAAQPDLLYLKADEIDANPFQPRREFNESEIASLAESLKSHEMLAPVLVRQVNGRYQLISGERRLRAAIRAGWPTVPARLRKADDRLVAELAIVENVQRKDLNPIEKAMAFKRYIDEHSCTQDELAQRIKIDRSTIANLMRLLELPGAVLDALRKGGITAGHARALLPLGNESEQIAFSDRIQREGLSVRDTERQVQEMVFKEDSPPDVVGVKTKRPKRTTTQQVASLQQELRMALGTKVEIRQSSRGRGRIVIHFQNHEEFERMRELLTGSADRKTREAA
jgi:ParB family chromosome partitioning protein